MATRGPSSTWSRPPSPSGAWRGWSMAGEDARARPRSALRSPPSCVTRRRSDREPNWPVRSRPASVSRCTGARQNGSGADEGAVAAGRSSASRLRGPQSRCPGRHAAGGRSRGPLRQRRPGCAHRPPARRTGLRRHGAGRPPASMDTAYRSPPRSPGRRLRAAVAGRRQRTRTTPGGWPMKVALYARVSSEAQEARGTIGSQLEVLRARVAAEGHELVAEFCDDGYSGARLNRPGLDALRDQAEAGAFDAVWCLSPDRLARAYAYQVLVLDELEQLGVRVLFSDAPALDDDPQARLLTQVQGVIAEYERCKIAERNRRGRLFRARAGEMVTWKAPYGYRRVPRDATGPARLEVFK